MGVYCWIELRFLLRQIGQRVWDSVRSYIDIVLTFWLGLDMEVSRRLFCSGISGLWHWSLTEQSMIIVPHLLLNSDIRQDLMKIHDKRHADDGAHTRRVKLNQKWIYSQHQTRQKRGEITLIIVKFMLKWK